MNRCPSADHLQEWLSGTLAASDSGLLESHLQDCLRCQQQVELLTSDPATEHWHRLHNQAQKLDRAASDLFLDQLAESIREGLAAGANSTGPLDLNPGADTGPWPRRNDSLDPALETAGPASVFPSLPGYKLLGEIGRGGMGVVYRAHHHGLNLAVALKMILTGKQARSEESARFRSEAETLAALRHPNIVQIFEVSEADGRMYVALELVEGPSLAEVIRARPQPAEMAAGMVETLAWAVQYVHEHGIIHRDLKPANILLQGDKETMRQGDKETNHAPVSVATMIPKIADFGLAKRIDLPQDLTRADRSWARPVTWRRNRRREREKRSVPGPIFMPWASSYMSA